MGPDAEIHNQAQSWVLGIQLKRRRREYLSKGVQDHDREIYRNSLTMLMGTYELQTNTVEPPWDQTRLSAAGPGSIPPGLSLMHELAFWSFPMVGGHAQFKCRGGLNLSGFDEFHWEEWMWSGCGWGGESRGHGGRGGSENCLECKIK